MATETNGTTTQPQALTAVDVFDRLDQNLRNGEPTPDALRHAVGVDDRGEVEP